MQVNKALHMVFVCSNVQELHALVAVYHRPPRAPTAPSCPRAPPWQPLPQTAALAPVPSDRIRPLPSRGSKRGRKCYVTPALPGVPNKGDKMRSQNLR